MENQGFRKPAMTMYGKDGKILLSVVMKSLERLVLWMGGE